MLEQFVEDCTSLFPWKWLRPRAGEESEESSPWGREKTCDGLTTTAILHSTAPLKDQEGEIEDWSSASKKGRVGEGGFHLCLFLIILLYLIINTLN